MQTDTIFLIGADGGLERIPHREYESEDLLQRLVEDHPEILVGDQIDPDNPPRWLLIKREMGIPDKDGGSDRWAIDHLLLDQDGKPTFVEVKRSTDTRIRREVVGQMLDYAANARMYWPKERIRELAAEASGGLASLDIKILEFLTNGRQVDVDAEPDTEAYWESVERHLRTGEVRLLFVADSIPAELRRIIEFLNEQMPLVEVLGVEIRQYEGKDVRALVPRVIGQTQLARQQKGGAPRLLKRTTQEEFLEKCTDAVREFFVHMFRVSKDEGYQVHWVTKGFSMRLPTPSGALVSLAYGYPPSDEKSAIFQCYLGYIEQAEVRDALRRELLSRAAFVEKGTYTLEVVLTDSSAQALIPVTQGLLHCVRQYVAQMK